MSSISADPVVIVDPYSAGRGLAAEFRARGVEPIAVLSSAGPPAAMSSTWAPDDFHRIEALTEPLGLDELVATVAGYRPRAVVAGAETGVELADALAARILPEQANDPARAAARRDKWAMARAQHDAGIPALRQICTADPGEVDAWLTATGLRGTQLIVKPPKSFGTDDVHLVTAGEDWRPYFDGVLNRVNIAAQRNEAVLVQEYAEGTEYMVDTYSVDGRHGLVEVCRYTKATRADRTGIYDCVDFLAPDDPVVAGLFEHSRRVLEAVGLRNGAAHIEVMSTPVGPRLIEIGARLAGAVHQKLARLATDDSQLDRIVAHHVDGIFRPGYTLARHVRIAFLSAERAGVLVNPEVLEPLRQLRCVHTLEVGFPAGAQVSRTDDLFSTLGHVILVAQNADDIVSDYRTVKELEGQLKIS